MHLKNVMVKCSVSATLMLASGSAAAVCGGPLTDNAFGRPLDYNDPQDTVVPQASCPGGCLNLVEGVHFDTDVETLQDGMTGPLPGDIQYVLGVYPNHYRALNAMATWQLQNDDAALALQATKATGPELQLFSVDCYFERATTFKPNDPTLYYLQGIYLHWKKDLDAALTAYEKAIGKGGDTAELHYNLGLLYLDLRDYDSARLHADKAYTMGVPLLGLRNKLERVGKW